MSVYSIFKKNLKIVSRNWSYFFVLIICPAILILVAGGMLNSFDTGNIRIGAYDEVGGACGGGMYVEIENRGFGGIEESFNLRQFGGTSCYDSLEECLNAVANSAIGACLHITESDNFYQVDVYLDNSRRLVEYYSKQLVLESVLGSQTSFIEATSDELTSKLTLYFLALVDARVELVNTEKDLGEQEVLLQERRDKLREVKQDFDSVYLPLKEIEPGLQTIRQQLLEDQQALENNISSFRFRKNELEFQINSLKTFLSTRLNQGDYEHSASILGLILQDLNDVDSVLSNIEDLQNVQDLLDALTLLESIIPKLDSINQALIETESDLGLAIEKTQESRIKVANYIIQLDSITQDLEVFGERLDTKTVSLNFKQNEVLSDNPVLFAFPMLVAIIITFTSLILSNLFVLRQVTNPSYFRELISPTKDICFLFADYLINLFFILIQSAVLFLVGIYWIGIPFDTLFAFALTIFIASSLFIFIGMSIGYLIKSQNLSMLLTIFLVMLFFITSELLIPAPLISPFIRFFLELNPFVLLSNILKNIFVLNNPLSVNTLRLIVLGIFLFFSGILVYVSRKINKVRMKE